MIAALKDNLYLLKFAFKYTKKNIILRLLVTFVSAASPFMSIVIMKLAVDAVSENLGVVKIILIVVGGLLIQLTACTISSLVEKRSTDVYNLVLQQEIHVKLMEKAQKLDLSCYDDTEFYDNYTFILKDIDQRIIDVVNNFVNFLKNILLLVMDLLLIFTLSSWIILAVAFVVFINYILNVGFGKLFYKIMVEKVPYERHKDYVKNIFYDPQFAQELRLERSCNFLIKDFVKNNNALINITKKFSLKSVLYFVGFNLTGFLLQSVVMIIASIQIILGKLTIGGFSASIYVASDLKDAIDGIIDFFPKLKENSLYINKLKFILEYEPMIYSTTGIIERNIDFNISFKNVSFRYPKSERLILKNINLNIYKNQKIAIVGSNGSGKSTLIKLILRFYDPVSGEIYLNDKNYKDYNVKCLREHMSVFLQDYKCLPYTASENISFIHNNEMTDEDECRIISAAKQGGIYDELLKYPQGLHTYLSKFFDNDGLPLSGGQQQKIALARAYYFNGDLLILDEPSSNLDPMAEYEMNENLFKLTKNKTVILISHRLNTVYMADTIYMLENGEIIESGTHDELMKNNGAYAKMFNMQAEKYRIN